MLAVRRVTAPDEAAASLVVFGLTFSVLFAFFTPIYAFDEFYQYAFMFLALAVTREGRLGAALLLCVAVVARESSVLVLPGFAVLWATQDASWRNPRRLLLTLLPLAIPLAFYVGWMTLLPIPDMPARWEHWRENFANRDRGVESVLSLALVLAVPLLLAKHARSRGEELHRKAPLLLAFAATLLLNTPIVFVATKAREARLFALPLVFLWPVAGSWLRLWSLRWRQAWHASPRGTARIVALALLGAGLLRVLLDFAYLPTLGGGFYDGYRLYAAVVFSIALATAALPQPAAIPDGR